MKPLLLTLMALISPYKTIYFTALMLSTVFCYPAQIEKGVYDDLFFSGQPGIQKLDTLDPNLRSTFSFAIDSEGRLLLGGHHGLAWFDGFSSHRFLNIKGETVGGPNFVEQIVPTNDGGIWLRNARYQLSYYAIESKIEYRDIAKNHFKVNQLELLSDNTLLLATENGIYKVVKDKGEFQFSPLDKEKEPSEVLYLTLQKENIFYATKKGIRRHSLNQPTENENFLYEGPVKSKIITGEDSELWFYDGNSIVQILNGTVKLKIESCPISDLLYSKHGHIWTTSLGCGVNIIDPQRGAVIQTLEESSNPRLSLETSTARSIFEDNEGTIWIGRFVLGFASISPNRTGFSNIKNNPGKPKRLFNNTIYYILHHSSGDIWLAHSNGGISILKPSGKLRKFISTSSKQKETDTLNSSASNLPKSPVYALTEDKNGSVYASLGMFGIYKIDPDDLTTVRINKGDLSKKLSYYNLVFRKTGELYASGAEGVFSVNTITGAVQQLTDDSGSSIGFKILHSFEDYQGNIWFSGSQHLFILPADEESTVKSIPWPQNLDKEHRLNNMFPSKSYHAYFNFGDDIWAANYDKKAQRADFEKMPFDGKAKGRFFEIEPKKLWSSHQKIDFLEGREYKFGQVDGIAATKSLYYANAMLSEDYQIYGSSDGLIVVRKPHTHEWNFDTPVVISEVAIDGSPYKGDRDNIIVPAKANTVTVLASALDYSSPKENRYAYRIKGYQNKWLESDYLGRLITLSNMAPGNYTLEIKGSNRHGVWGSKPKLVHITVTPDWHETMWFKIII